MKINFLKTIRRDALALLSIICLSAPVKAALVPGDIAVVGFNAEGTDANYASFKFAFVLLKDVTANDGPIYFTDKGWIAGAFSSNTIADGVLKWTPTSTFAAGTLITVTINGSSATFSSSNSSFTSQSAVASGWTNATVSSGGGDQVLVFQGSEAAPTFIYGFTNTASATVHTVAGSWAASGVANSATNSELPQGLTNGMTAVANTKDPGVGSTDAQRNATNGWHADNLYFKGPYTGTREALLTAIGNPANWYGDDANPATVNIDPGGGHFPGTNPSFTVSTPTITLSGSTALFTACLGSPSAVQTLTVSGSGLTENISVTAPTGFEISLSQASGFAPSLTLTQSGGTVGSTSIFVRLKANATGSPSGNVTFASSGAPSKTKAVDGSVTSLSASTSQTNVSCNGLKDGSAGVVVSGGTTSYTYLWSPSGGSGATASGLAAGNYSVLITDAKSCTLTKNFTLTEPSALDVSVTANGATLMANATGVSYQWVNCNNAYAIVPNAVNQSYIAPNGRFGVIITKGVCKDTSTCITVTITGMEGEEEAANHSAIFPNPTKGSFALHVPQGTSLMKIMDTRGQEVFTKALQNQTELGIELHVPAGMYHVVLSGSKNKTYKLIVE